MPEDRAAIRIDLHLFHHFDGPIEVALPGPIFVGRAPNRAVKAVLTVGEAPPMATAQVNVDTTNEIASLQFVDDKGDVNAAQPEGATVQFTSSDESVLTIAPDSANPLQGDITVVGEGTADIGASVTGADGSPAFADAVESTTVTVVAGAAVGARLSVEGQSV